MISERQKLFAYFAFHLENIKMERILRFDNEYFTRSDLYEHILNQKSTYEDITGSSWPIGVRGHIRLLTNKFMWYGFLERGGCYKNDEIEERHLLTNWDVSASKNWVHTYRINPKNRTPLDNYDSLLTFISKRIK